MTAHYPLIICYLLIISKYYPHSEGTIRENPKIRVQSVVIRVPLHHGADCITVPITPGIYYRNSSLIIKTLPRFRLMRIPITYHSLSSPRTFFAEFIDAPPWFWLTQIRFPLVIQHVFAEFRFDMITGFLVQQIVVRRFAVERSILLNTIRVGFTGRSYPECLLHGTDMILILRVPHPPRGAEYHFRAPRRGCF